MNKDMQPEDIARIGEDIYLTRLRSHLEPDHHGEYVVIEVESGDYRVAPDPVTAIHEARDAYPGKMFHVVQVGFMEERTIDYTKNFYAG